MIKLEQTLNSYGNSKTPIFFLISFDLNDWEVIPLDELKDDIIFEINSEPKTSGSAIKLEKSPISFEKYREKFDLVKNHIREGNSYLLNLTAPTKIKTDVGLRPIYDVASARFKLFYKEKFVSFSPERFVNIQNGRIYTYPMKGTIDASLDFAEAKILGDSKEMSEHTMVVDLLRNDLGIIGENVKVERFRYCEKISAGEKELLQVSSKISASLKEDWQSRLGTILTSMLPAGSITGTPKKMTTKLIKEIEGYDRGYFTGIWGVFDGVNLDSAVLIRFIEKTPSGFVYKSGGGITSDSDAGSEYKELIDKVYIP